MRYFFASLFCLLICASGCREQKRAEPPSHTPAAPPGTSVPDGQAEQGAAGLATAPEKQLIIIYCGDTLSIPDANYDYTPPEGGLSALAHAITTYEAQLVEYGRLRILNEGGDAANAKADFASGMLGEHPFLLLDYGGWSRPNDYAGAPYVALSFRMYDDLAFTAVGCLRYYQLSSERWQAYSALTPAPPLLVSSRRHLPGALPARREVTREIHGARWCIVALPLPPKAEQNFPAFRALIDEAAEVVAGQQADYSILMLAAAPGQVYNELAAAGRFSVVIGCNKHNGVPEGYGELTPGAPLLLPEIEAGGREIGICHLYWQGGRSAPSHFRFVKRTCTEDAQLPYPYRKQVAAAMAEHARLVAEREAAAKIGTP